MCIHSILVLMVMFSVSSETIALLSNSSWFPHHCLLIHVFSSVPFQSVDVKNFISQALKWTKMTSFRALHRL